MGVICDRILNSKIHIFAYNVIRTGGEITTPINLGQYMFSRKSYNPVGKTLRANFSVAETHSTTAAKQWRRDGTIRTSID